MTSQGGTRGVYNRVAHPHLPCFDALRACSLYYRHAYICSERGCRQATAGSARARRDSAGRDPVRSIPTAQAFGVEGLPPCTITRATDGLWYVTAQLAPDEQAASVAAALEPTALCRQAQHALGMAGIGSRIAPDDNAIGIYAPLTAPSVVTPLVLEGRALLWALSRAPSEAIQALIAAALAIVTVA